MKYIKKSLALIIAWQLLIFSNAVSAQEVKKQQAITNMAIKLVKAEMEQNNNFYYPQRYTGIQADTAPEMIVNENEKILERLRDDSFSLNEIKEEIITSIVLEEQNHIREFSYILDRMGSETVENIFSKSVDKGKYSPEFQDRYDMAYTVAEKKDVLLSMLASDLAAVKSSSIKRVGMASRDLLIQELELANTFFNVDSLSRKWKEVALIALTVLLAGFATWGVFNSIKKSYAKKTKKMHEDYDQRETDLENEYAEKELQLIAEIEERNRLREEGYVWQVCSVTTTTKSASCSYDYSSRSGPEVCTTRCLKNPSTGAEEMHSTSCTSAYIPSNCFVKNPYDEGYDDGYDEGYDDGYDYSYQRAYDQAYYDYYNDAYDSAYTRGYDWGYTAGYSDGLSEAEYDDSQYDDTDSLLKSNDTNKDGYKKGYREGYTYAQMILLGRL